MLTYLVPILLLILILITQNIILLNEESLILACFVVFCWLSIKNLSKSISDSLTFREKQITKELKQSLHQIIISTNKLTRFHEKFWFLFYNFKQLGNYCLNLTNIITSWTSSYLLNKNQNLFSKKLLFLTRIEQQTATLLTLLIIKKLEKIVELKFFYSIIIEDPYLKCSNKISIREYINIINKI